MRNVYRLIGVTAGMMLILNCRQAEEKDGRRVDFISQDTLESLTGAVLPVNQGPSLLRACTRNRPRGVTGFFSPTATEIAQLEMRLPLALARQRDAVDEGPPMRNYYRQYMGILRAGTRKVIYVNAFPREHLVRINDVIARLPKESVHQPDTATWRTDPVSVCDGGKQYWSVEFDVESAIFDEFHVNQSGT